MLGFEWLLGGEVGQDDVVAARALVLDGGRAPRCVALVVVGAGGGQLAPPLELVSIHHREGEGLSRPPLGLGLGLRLALSLRPGLLPLDLPLIPLHVDGREVDRAEGEGEEGEGAVVARLARPAPADGGLCPVGRHHLE